MADLRESDKDKNTASAGQLQLASADVKMLLFYYYIKLHMAKETTCNIKKFWFEVGEGYTLTLILNEKMKSVDQKYQISLHQAHKDELLIQDDKIEEIVFTWFVLRSVDFREIKLKIDPETLLKLVELKTKDLTEIWITLNAVAL